MSNAELFRVLENLSSRKGPSYGIVHIDESDSDWDDNNTDTQVQVLDGSEVKTYVPQ